MSGTGTGSGPGSGNGSGRHASQPTSGGGGRAAALAAGAVVLVAIIAAAATGWPVDMPWSGSDTSAQQRGQAGSSASGGGSSAGDSPSGASDSYGEGATAAWLRTCATRVAGEEKVVAAAAAGVRDWHGHVQARTDMFAGRITQERMHEIWTRTKLAGPGDQQRFQAAAHQHPSQSPCSRTGDVPARYRTMVTDCRERSGAVARAVTAAHAAMKDWQSHLTNMATYADGEMSETMAQDRWVASWRHAPTNISAYTSARATLRTAPACSSQAG